MGAARETYVSAPENAARDAFLLCLSDTLWSLSDPAEIQSAAARCYGEHICANRVLFMDLLDGKETLIRDDFVTGVASMAGRYPAGWLGGEALAMLQSGQCVVVNDTASGRPLLGPMRQTLQEAQVASLMIAGMLKDGRLIAAFGAHSATPRVWTASEIGLLRETAERTWRAVERARTSLAWQDKFCRQVNHRVKNDLQLIASLLNLQANQVEDSRLQALLEKSRNRVYAIAAIYDLIQRSQDLSNINVAEYVQQLVPVLARFHESGSRVVFRMEATPGILDFERAVPFGLLLHELISNVCTHAFPVGRHGEVTIQLTRDHSDHVVAVADNGPGFPPGLDFRQPASLGLRLVHVLARQLGGQAELLPAGGVHIVVRFPANNDKQEPDR